ncbi:MAG: branched-chain amino acid ABC transporter permease [Gammaproteobacteria bacterium]
MSHSNGQAGSLALALAFAIAVLVYAVALLRVESQLGVMLMLVAGAGAVLAAARTGIMTRIEQGLASYSISPSMLVLVGAALTSAYFYDDHFVLLMVGTVVLYIVAALGINVQFGYSGVLNFAGAAFFGVGCYTAAVLSVHTPIPHVLILLAGGGVAALIGALLIVPVLRTRGHYSAVITIAFTILFSTFLEVNDVLGGPQGLAVDSFQILGWDFNSGVTIGGFETSFYLNYVIAGLVLLAIVFTLVRRLERSWIGLNWDAVRLDETAAACFGLSITRWKVTAFTVGNFLAGMAGALYAMMIGFIAPQNFTFGDSLILVSIVLLGGIGNAWGVVLATVIIIVVPEKLQAIQEYRFLLFSAMVILVLLFRPTGLLPRPTRVYFPGWRPS